MRKVLIQKPGGYERLEVVRTTDPVAGADEVIVATEAIGVNYADCIVRMGFYSSAAKYVGWPITPGFEFAGRVLSAGDKVHRFRPGDAVFGVTRFGGYASQVRIPQVQLLALPEGWSMQRAAAFPTVHLTAWYALRELSRPRPGSKVLVHSAAGGVGTAALRICRHLQLSPIAVVGEPHKVRVARQAGAEAVIVRSEQDLWQQVKLLAPEGLDLVLESNGVQTMRQSYDHLAPGGRLVVFGLASMLPRGGRRPKWWRLLWDYLRSPRFNPIRMLDVNRSVLAFNLSYLFGANELLHEAMVELLGWAEQGALPAPPIKEFALDAVAEAHRALETGSTVGKLVLIP